MGQPQAVAAALDTFVKEGLLHHLVPVSAHKNDAVNSTQKAESHITWAAPVAVAAPNCNVATHARADTLVLEACVCRDNGTMGPGAGAAMTMMKDVILALFGSKQDAKLVEVMCKTMDRNPNVTNGTTYTACAAVAVRATVLTMAFAIVRVAIGIKVLGLQ